MIPISDDNPVRLTPIVTVGLIIACIVVYVWQVRHATDASWIYHTYGFIPSSLLSPQYEWFVSSSGSGVSATATIFTSMFLHGSIWHLAGNMLYLWIFGNNIEDAMGHVRYLLFYLVSGVAAALTMAYMDPSSTMPMVGASGAISGVLGAYMLLYPRARVTVLVPLVIILYPFRLSAVWVVGAWFAMQLVAATVSTPASPGVAWWAHVGGFIAGMAMTPFLKSAQVPFFGPKFTRGPWG